MAVLAELTADGSRIACASEFRYKDMLKTLPGARWDRESGNWVMPVSWSACVALRETLGANLEVGPNLADWARHHHKTTIEPALRWKDVIETAEGDADLFAHQRADVQYLKHVRRAILANEPGTGKTASVVRTLAALSREGVPIFPALIVSPNTVKRGWKREFEKWWPTTEMGGPNIQVIDGTALQRRRQFADDPDVVVINYESLKSHSRLAPYGSVALARCVECGGEDPKITPTKCHVHQRELNHIKFASVVADEAHRIKDPMTQQARALKAAAPEADLRLALTGTPIANNVIDLWSILNFIDPDEWPSKVRWIDRLVDVTYNIWGGIVVSGLKAGAQAEFEKTVRPRIRRMTKEVVLPFLPPILSERRDVPMTPKQRKAYDDLVKTMLAILEADDGTRDMLVTTNTMTRTLRLLQLASSYGELDTSTPDSEKLILSAPSSKVSAFIDDLDDFTSRSTIVFAVSRQLIMLLSKELEKLDIKHGLITGGQSTAERQNAIDDFQEGKTRFILSTIGAGGTGITLTAADTVVYLQRSWSLIEMDQSIARAHRPGSEKHENILRIDYVCPDSIEEAVIASLEGKVEGLEELVRDRELLARWLRGEAS